MNNYYTIKEVAKNLKVNYRTVLREVNRGRLLTFKIGRLLLVSEEQLQQYLSKTGIQPIRIAVAVVINKNNVLIVKRKYKEGTLQWQFPSGRVRYKEKTSTRAEIECLEETGIHCKAKKLVGYRIHPDTGAIIYYWISEYIYGEEYNVDSSENSEVKWVNLVEPETLFTSNYYIPVKNYLRELYISLA